MWILHPDYIITFPTAMIIPTPNHWAQGHTKTF